MKISKRPQKKYDRRFEKWEETLPPEKLGNVYDSIGWDSWRGIIKQDLLYCFKHLGVSNILDVGCFRGDYLQVLIDQNISFTYEGVDVAPRYVAFAQKRFSAFMPTETQSLRFIEGNIFELPYGDGIWDLVLCTGVLIHLPELARPLDELFRVSSRYLLLGVDVHPEAQDEITTVRNGFLYKTWSRPFIFSEIEKQGVIVKVSTFKSPDYTYSHYSIIVEKSSRPQR
jgi:SAM-dependent methyltransferase